MDTSKLKKFAQFARRNLIEQVQSKLKLVLADESAARREYPKAVKDLEQKLSQHSDKKVGEEQLIDKVAYTWFNRFCALRFMDVNPYNRIMVLSPISGQFQPEILAEAKAGHLDGKVFNDKTREKIKGLLSGSVPSRDGQAEAYRLMIVAVCNDYYRLMPYLFERIEDYTELLMPDDLLSGNSILAYTREAMTPENCESVESIGWLYQFYISEKKDQVFEDLKKNKKITPENIPAATQLFTPHWIVKYLVENSLGRLWMLNNPNSKVIDQMEYYIKPIKEETDFLKIGSPEELKICDPACGSGHMLTYAYDLLYAIYLDANYDDTDIPELILTKNLFGIEIDDRAAELAAFALSMKALKGNPNDESNNRRRFFRNPIKPNICRLEKVQIDENELNEYMDFIGRDLFTSELRKTLTEFEEADNFGSLIQPTLAHVDDILAIIEAKNEHVDMFLANTHKSVLKVLRQARYLSPKYHAVIANPPYMGGKGMNPRLAKWAKDNYPVSKADLFAMFMERDLALVIKKGFSAMINMQSWMFLSSFEGLRFKLLANSTIVSMAHLGTRAFDSIGGEVVSTTAFVLENASKPEVAYPYIRLVDGRSEKEKEDLLLGERADISFTANIDDFKKLPGKPIAYWISDRIINVFSNAQNLSTFSDIGKGLDTGDNDRFLRLWWEVSKKSDKWLPCQKGGPFRKWYGNNDYVINWEDEGKELKEFKGSNLRNAHNYKKSGLSWSRISSNAAFRYFPEGHIFESTGPCVFVKDLPVFSVAGFLNSKLAEKFLQFIAPTLDFQSGHISALPVSNIDWEEIPLVDPPKNCIEISKNDWNSIETSNEFMCFPLIERSVVPKTFKDQFDLFYDNSIETTRQLHHFEELNNKNFIEAYGLKHELDDKVELSSISLFCNPNYRYGDKNSVELSNLYLKDTSVDFLSYAIGCVFGRYSIDKKDLILASQGETLEEYLKQVPSPSFMPDEDNVIPIIDFDGDWFEDDITESFKAFLRITFGEENFTENLAFIEEAIGKDIKKYFVKDFYTDHVKRYKKRPIYWMFSSPKGSFNALIYMHRYQPDTASIVLNDYLREFRTKLEARKESYEQIEISVSASQKDITQAIKAIAKINKVLEEVNDYEHDVLYPLAGEKIEIDLDDGVKHNYPLFGKALKKVTGLS
jgi:type II restriction/modification system DNA methylase subunit YeeA